MSQEPFDFSSTAESDFAPSHAVCIEENKRRRHIYRLHIHHRKRCRFYSSDLVGCDLLPFHSASYTKTLILIVMGVMFAIFFFHRHKILYGIKNAFKCS